MDEDVFSIVQELKGSVAHCCLLIAIESLEDYVNYFKDDVKPFDGPLLFL